MVSIWHNLFMVYIHFVCGKLITLIEVFAIKILLKLRFESVLHNELYGSNLTQQATKGRPYMITLTDFRLECFKIMASKSGLL